MSFNCPRRDYRRRRSINLSLTNFFFLKLLLFLRCSELPLSILECAGSQRLLRINRMSHLTQCKGACNENWGCGGEVSKSDFILIILAQCGFPLLFNLITNTTSTF